MDAFLDKFHFLKSRKWWAFIGGVFGILSAAFQAEVFPVQEVIMGIVALVLGYMGTTAWEDTAMKKAMMAPMTTVETPATTDVTITAPAETLPKPTVGLTGLH